MNLSDIAAVSVREVWELRERFIDGLAPRERDVFDRMTVDKRRREWLAGRVAAKRSIQKKLGLPFARFEIRVEENGRPQLLVDGRPGELHLSITHSNDVAAAITARQPIGFDLERIEPRERSFEDLVLGEGDREQLAGLVGAARDERLTLLWCEKEAYAKLTGQGLRIPFAQLIVPRDVTVDSGTLVLGSIPFAYAVVLASAQWLTTPALVAKES